MSMAYICFGMFTHIGLGLSTADDDNDVTTLNEHRQRWWTFDYAS